GGFQLDRGAAPAQCHLARRHGPVGKSGARSDRIQADRRLRHPRGHASRPAHRYLQGSLDMSLASSIATSLQSPLRRGIALFVAMFVIIVITGMVQGGASILLILTQATAF